jgi:hypothetical protein
MGARPIPPTAEESADGFERDAVSVSGEAWSVARGIAREPLRDRSRFTGAACHRGKKAAGTEKGPYVTYNPLGLRQNHFFLKHGIVGRILSH